MSSEELLTGRARETIQIRKMMKGRAGGGEGTGGKDPAELKVHPFVHRWHQRHMAREQQQQLLLL